MRNIVDLTELQYKLDEISGRNIRVKPRTASLNDTHNLLEEGYTIKHVAKMMRVPESTIAKYEEKRRTFLSTGKLPSKYHVHTAFSGASWTNYY
jgi:hypothetical protein